MASNLGTTVFRTSFAKNTLTGGGGNSGKTIFIKPIGQLKRANFQMSIEQSGSMVWVYLQFH